MTDRQRVIDRQREYEQAEANEKQALRLFQDAGYAHFGRGESFRGFDSSPCAMAREAYHLAVTAREYARDMYYTAADEYLPPLAS